MKIIKKILKWIGIFFGILILFFSCYFFVGSVPETEDISWGVNFSQKQAKDLGLDWQETYLALLDDLKVKKIKLITHWDLLEPEQDNYFFDDLDWQIKEARERDVQILLAIGMKTPRWPECHIPKWAEQKDKEGQQERITALLKEIVLRYKNEPSINMWQVENEPFVPFGVCPWVDKAFLKKEIELVKSLDDKNRKILISDSGEGSFWIVAANLGDIVGTTMYEKVWIHQIGAYFTYPYPPVFYGRKAQIIKKIFNKEVICVELQAEPWSPEQLINTPIKKQEETMNLEKFQQNIEFAKKSGLKEFYLWGGEWWYWMKEKQDNPEIWDEAEKLFIQ